MIYMIGMNVKPQANSLSKAPMAVLTLHIARMPSKVDSKKSKMPAKRLFTWLLILGPVLLMAMFPEILVLHQVAVFSTKNTQAK